MGGDDLDRYQRAPANFGSVGVFPQYRNQGDDDHGSLEAKKARLHGGGENKKGHSGGGVVEGPRIQNAQVRNESKKKVHTT